jgi:hypothetical protein
MEIIEKKHIPALQMRGGSSGTRGRIILFIGFWLLTAWILPAKGEIYKWVDSKGIIHFSNVPPPDGNGKKAAKMDEWGHDAEAHAARIRVTEEAQENELKEFYSQKEAARKASEERANQAEEQNTRKAELERKIKFERKRLESLIHEDRTDQWNTHVATQLELLAADPETYFKFQMDQTGRLPAEQEPAPIQEENLESESGQALKYRPHVTDPYTGELIPEKGGTGSRGTPYIKSGKGYLNTKTGRFFEIAQ